MFPPTFVRTRETERGSSGGRAAGGYSAFVAGPGMSQHLVFRALRFGAMADADAVSGECVASSADVEA